MGDRMVVAAKDDIEVSGRGGVAWSQRALLAERDRWLLWVPVGLGIGVAGYFGLTEEPPAGAGAAVVVVLSLLFWWRRGESFVSRVVIFAMLSVALGFACAQVRTMWVAAPVLQDKHGPDWVSGRLLEVEPRGGLSHRHRG